MASEDPAHPAAESTTEPVAAASPGRYPWTIWLPAGLSSVLLFGIAAAFLGLSRPINEHRHMIGDVLEPANRRLTRFQILFLQEVATARAYVALPAAPTLGEVRALHAQARRAIDGLSTNVPPMGPGFARDLATLHDAFALWEAAPVAVMTGRTTVDALRPRLLHQEMLSDNVIAKVSQLDDAVSLRWRDEMALMQRLVRLRLYVLMGLLPLTLLGIVLTAWLAKRAMRSQQLLVENSAQEALLRDAIAALTGDQVLPAALNRIAANAMRMGAAEGAFIEHSHHDRGEVEIVAAVGVGAPPSGMRVKFVGSITDDIVHEGTTELAADLTGRDSELGRLVGTLWPRCFGLAVPLQAEGDVDGALVLIRGNHHLHVRGETLSRLKALGAWAALALRRQRLSLQLASERARLEGVIEEMPVGVALAEAPSGRVTMFNRHAVELWGSPVSPPVSIDAYSQWKLFHPDGREYETGERPLARSILKGSIVQGEEAEVERADGLRTPVRINSAPIRDARGVIIGGVATVDDISEEKRRELATRFLDEISRQLASSLDYDATMDAILRLMVPRMADVASLHHRAGDTITRRWTAGDNATINGRLTDLDRDYPMPIPSAHPIATAIRTGKPQLREFVSDELLQAIAKDERQLEWLRSLGLQSAMAVPLVVRGHTIGALQLLSMNPARHYGCDDLAFLEEIGQRASLAIDNAELFRTVHEAGTVSGFLAEAALALSGSLEREEVLRRVTSLAVPSFADFALGYVRDEQGEVHHVAAAHRDAAKQPLLEEAVSLYRPDPSNLGSTMAKALSTAQPVLVEQVTAELLDSQRFQPRVRELFEALAPSSWITVPLVARDKTLGALVFGTVTSAHRFEAKDVTLAQRLAGASALAMQNAMLYHSAQGAVSSRDEMLGIVSHDLRNPLHTIGMSSQLLLEGGLDDAQRARHLEIIDRARGRMERLIQDLLDVTRVEAGKELAIDRKEEQLPALVREVCESFVLDAREKQVTLEWRAPEEIPRVHADRARIHQVLANIIGNALKFTPEGGRIEVRVSEDKGMALVSVEDSGPGIPGEDLERIFRPFWQAARGARQGAGLGLAIARGIVEQHGGKVWAASQEGVGTTFFFTLPEVRAQEARAA